MDFRNIAGPIEVRLVKNKSELEEAMRIRYRLLILEYNHLNTNMHAIDYEPIDEVCDHLIAIDNEKNKIIGTYRLIRKQHTDVFVSEKEYDISNIKNRRLLEISRAVVDEKYRDGVVITLLWRSIIQYALYYDAEFMIGTASFYGLDVMQYAHAFSYLYYHHLSPEAILCQANAPFSPLNLLPLNELNIQIAKRQLPPLVKGYLRLGCTIGNGIYIDPPFNSIDVLIVLEIKAIEKRYLKRILGIENE